MDDLQKYSTYTVTDFLADDHFIYWAQYPDKGNQALWTAVGMAYPEKQEMMGKARELAIALGSMETRFSAEKRDRLWLQIENRTTQAPPKGLRVFINKWKVAMAAAAVVLVIIVAGINTFLHTNKVITTDFSSRMTLRLPDESVLVLNRNSSVQYARLWNINRLREVTMTGEVDFTVKHVATQGKPMAADSFRINVSDLRITVLGTAFNIHSRRGKTAISLRNGKLRIDFMKGHQSSVFLLPGEQFVYDTLAAKNLPQPANVVAAAAWKENTLVLEGTRFADVVAMLEDDYGYKVVVADTSLLNRKLRGNVPMKEVNNLFFIIEQILDVNVEQQNDTLRITSR